MSRPPRHGLPTSHREKLRQDFTRAATLRQVHPGLAEVRIELEFHDDTSPPPSPQAFSYFPAARGFFRFACPCHSCSGEFDLSSHVAELAGSGERTRLVRKVTLECTGQRPLELRVREACPVRASIRISATMRTTG